jgi:hypothetical protein
MKEKFLTVSDLAEVLGITYQGALKKLRTNEEELKPYLVRDKKKNIKGITEEGLEAIRQLPHRVSYASRKAQEEDRQRSILERDLESKDEIIKSKQAFIDELLKDKEELKARVLGLEAELEAYRTGGFIVRLLGYKKK